MLKRQNLQLREDLKKNGVCQWEVAEAIGMREAEFSRKMRKPLSPELEKKVYQAMSELKKAAVREGAV